MERYTVEHLLQGPRDIKFPVPGKVDKDGNPIEVTVYIRPVRDPERAIITTKARTASRTMRKLLKDKKSEQYQTLIEETMDNADEDALRQVWINGRLIERVMRIRDASLEDREVIPEPEGTGVTPKQLDEYENAVDDAEENREEEVIKAIRRAQEELEAEAAKIPTKKLREAALEPLIETICKEANENEFMAQVMLRCTFSDKKCTKRAFSDIEQIFSLPPHYYKKLLNEHIALMLEQEAVKN